MKRKFLFLIGALVSVFSTALAWDKPAVPASQPLATDGVTEQYLYNPGADGFLLGANNYNTRASVSATHGYKWRVEITDENIPYFAFVNYCEKVNSGSPDWLRMFCENASATYVDNNNGQNNDKWVITFGANNTFTISNAGVVKDGTDLIEGLLGVRAAEQNDSRCYFTSAYPEETLYTDWYAVSAEEYERYSVASAVYQAAMTLKEAMDNAKAEYSNIDLSVPEAVYNNPAATAEELTAALADVSAAAVKAAEASATWTSPKDLTSSIDNPSFETGAMGKWTTAGSGGDTGVKENSNGTYTAEGCDKAYLFNTWGRTPLIVDQVVEGLPKGIYKLTSLYASDAGNVGRLYANSDTLNIDASADGKGYFVEGTLLTATADGKLKIGMTSDQWFKTDNFRLTYHGNDAEGSQEYVKSLAVEFDPEAQITTSLIDDYNNLVEATWPTVNNVDDAMAALASFNAAKALIEENAAAWANYNAKLTTANATLQDEMIDGSAQAVLDLGDYIMESEEFINNKELSTAEIEAELVKLEGMVADAMQCLKGGADFTRYLKNPEMDAAAGWNGSPAINEKCGEKYGGNADFDVYQIIEDDVPVGLYEISMQGFYREFRDDDANKTAWYNVFMDDKDYDVNASDYARRYKDGCPKPIAYVYMNTNKNPLNCVYDYAVEGTYNADAETKFTCDFYGSGFSVDPYNKYAYPNNMATAAKAFAVGAYKVSAYGLIAKVGDKLRLGVKGHLGGSDWAIFDNFKLTYRAKDAAIINKLLPDAKAALDLTDKKVGKDVKEYVANTLQMAENASSNDDKFNALAKCFELNDVIDTSVEKFAELEKAIADLESALNNAGNIGVAESVMTDAGVLMTDAYNGWNDGTYTDAEAAEAITKINSMITLLQIPENLGSDDNPVDMTGFIKDAALEGLSAKGDKFGAWTWTKGGGNGPVFPNGASSSTASEFWIGSANDLKFSLTQEITGLPAGKYGLSAFAGNSYNGVEPLGNTGRAYLFAETAGKTVIPSVAVEPSTNDANAGDTQYKVVFTVEEGDVVTVGFKTAGTMDARWFWCDTFALECYGTNSSQADTPDNMSAATAIMNTTDNTVATPVAIFNASGVMTQKLHKGLNIVRMSDGKVRKVMVK